MKKMGRKLEEKIIKLLLKNDVKDKDDEAMLLKQLDEIYQNSN
mgnify:CR=1 FL=1